MSTDKTDPVVKPLDNHVTGTGDGTATTQDNHVTDTETVSKTDDNHVTTEPAG
ncbi:hypothetical protein [Streptomyces sp. GC420]|uniref:hypothetical protein n=1 Tax=Streptomyces sp. GC420 TaxID=2697568 RepID=UPI001414FFEE|nr:hypothetical protein [Streptomyces sp. GC420]